MTQTNTHILLRVKDAAKVYGVDEETVRRWARTGIIEAEKQGKFWYFPVPTLFKKGNNDENNA